MPQFLRRRPVTRTVALRQQPKPAQFASAAPEHPGTPRGPPPRKVLDVDLVRTLEAGRSARSPSAPPHHAAPAAVNALDVHDAASDAAGPKLTAVSAHSPIFCHNRGLARRAADTPP